MSKFNNMKKIAIILAAVLCVILILVAVIALGRKDNEDVQQPLQTEAPATEDKTPVETEENLPQDPSAPTEPDETEPQETKGENNKDDKPGNTQKPGNSDKPGNTQKPGNSDKPGNTQKPEDNPEKEPDRTVRFPYTIAGTDLVIDQVNSYDGLFFEDGSDKEVSNVTAIVLTNRGSTCVEYVNITMQRDDTQLRFVGSTLEAGDTMIILEADRKKFQNGEYKNCTAEISTIAKLTMSEGLLRVEENEKGGLLVTNLTDKDIPCVRIFYKYYMDDVDVYVGGITYTAKILDLAAEGSVIVTPSHYYSGFSKILMIKTYDTKD